MTDRRAILHRYIMVVALILSVVALPFSVKACHSAMILLLINWVLEGHWRAKFSVIRQSLLLQLTIALFALELFGLLFSDLPIRGWFSIEKKIFFLMIPIALATTQVKLTRRELRWIMTSFVTACLIGTAICLAYAWEQANLVGAGAIAVDPYFSTSRYFDVHPDESQQWLLFSYVSLSKGIYIHPTYLSLFLSLSVAFILYEFPSAQSAAKKAGLLALLLYFTLFIVFLSARIVIVGVAVMYLVVLILCAIRKKKSFALMAVGIIGFFTSLLFLNPVTNYRSLEDIRIASFHIEPGTHYTSAAQIRLSLWWLGLSTLKDINPFVGAGTGDVEHVMTRTSEKYQITNVIQSSDPHNQYLYTMIANGVPAVFVLISCLLLPAWCAWVEKDLLLLGFLFLFALVCVTESALELQKGIAFYALFSGILYFQLYSFQRISVNLRSRLRVEQ